MAPRQFDTLTPLRPARAGLPFALAAMVGIACAPAAKNGNCGITQSLAHALPEKVDPAPRMIGGFLNIEFAQGEPKRCAAHVEILRLGGEPRAIVWTARHCSSERFKDAKKFTLDLALGGTYERGIEVLDDFLERRKGALAEAESKGLHETARKAIAESFDVYLGVQAKREDAGCSNEDFATESREKGLHSVCANWWDLGVYEVRFAQGLSSGPLYTKLSAAKTAFESARRAASTKLGLAKSDLSNPEGWRADLIEAWRLQRQKTSAGVLRWIEETCDARKGDAQAPQAACAGRDDLVDIAERYLVEGDESIVRKASNLGYGDGAKLLTPPGSPPLEDALKQLEGERVIRIQDRWRKFGRKHLFTSKNIFLNTNITQSDTASLKASYISMPLSSLAGSGLILKFVTHGFEYAVAKDKVAIQFLPGDSGTVFAIEGIWPVLALSGVDGEQSSGGASVSALPTRRKSAGGAGGAGAGESATDNRKTGKETASVDPGC